MANIRELLFIAITCTIGQIISSVLVGYGLARLKFPGRKLWFSLFIGSLMLPGFVGMIPMFNLYTSIGWYDSWLPIIVPAFWKRHVLVPVRPVFTNDFRFV